MQNTSRNLLRLHVDTLHWKYFAPNAISVLHSVQRIQYSAMTGQSLIRPQTEAARERRVSA